MGLVVDGTTLNLQKNIGIECLKILRLDDTMPQQGSNVLPVVVELLELSNTLAIYPNPASMAFYIESPQAVERAVLYHLSGQYIHERERKGTHRALDLPTLTSSTCVLRVWTHEGVYVQRIVLQQ